MYQAKSIFQNLIRDARAVYLAPCKEGNDAVRLQDAINMVADKLGQGIVFVGEGTYEIDRTIYIPTGVRVIGWGKKRPVLKLADNCPALAVPEKDDKGGAAYMLWFVGRKPEKGMPIFDANAGTFYSALYNVDLDMGRGNREAVAVRSHYAQHSFISHVHMTVNDAKAGIFDTGNIMDNVAIDGGDYGVYTTKSSPAWQFTMLDCALSNQRIAGILTREAGLTVVDASFEHMPIGVKTWEGFTEKFYGENLWFNDITDAAVVMDEENSVYGHYHLEDTVMKHVALAVRSQNGEKAYAAPAEAFRVVDFTHGYTMEKTAAKAEHQVVFKTKVLARAAKNNRSHLLPLPEVNTWVNAADTGVIGDNKSDVTQALQKLIDENEVVYLPMGRYVITAPLKLKENTKLIGLHPMMTQIVVHDNTPAFSFFGAPVPMLTTPLGGENIINGIGLNPGGKNARAVCLKWQSGEHSMVQDVKFVGGHGSVTPNGERESAYNQSHTADFDESRKWDSMYPSLWVKGGGGVFADVWSAAPYASAGVLVDDTDVPGCMFEVSVEHHVRAEVKFRKVKNWDIYCLQLEEEVCESSYCQPLEIIDCENMKFANFYAFRVIWLVNPWKYATLLWNSKNITFYGYHNFTQVKLTMDNALYDVTRHLEVRPWELGKLVIGGSEKGKRYLPGEIASEFEFIDGMCTDSKGNVYFADGHRKRIYRWNAEADRCELILDGPFKPLSLATDTEDRLLVVTEYFPQRGMMVDGKPERYPVPADSREVDYGKWYGMLGNDIRVYAIDPENPWESFEELKTAKMADLKPERVWYAANRWRNTNDWLRITVTQTEEAFVAPDGKTIIPDQWDLIRANSLAAAVPGKTFFCLDEYYRRTYAFDVNENGWLENPTLVAERGEQGITEGDKLYIADGNILVMNKEGGIEKEIDVALRPAALALANGYIYAACRSSLFRFKI